MKYEYKKYFLLLLLFIGFVGLSKILLANNTSGGDYYQKRFHEANELYQQNKFQQALANYNELLEMEIEEAALFYNTANTYVQLGQNGRAVWMYEKAFRLQPRNEFIKFNLAKIAPVANDPEIFILFAPFKKLRSFFTLNEWAMIASAAWIALAVLIALANIVESEVPRRYAKILSLGLTGICALSSLFLFSAYRNEFVNAKAIVLEFVDTHSGPSAEFTKQLSLPAGRKVVLQSEASDWTEIAIPGESQRTYIKTEKLGRI